MKMKQNKRCYAVCPRVGLSKMFRGAGKIVWLSDKELILARIKYPDRFFDEVIDKEVIEKYKVYMHQTIE